MRILLNRIFVNPYANLAILTFLLVLLFAIGLGDRPYSAPSESRYIEIGREMAESGDYVTPRLDYVKYFEKPALFYWVQAQATKYLGIGAFAVRIPTALFAVCLCLLTYALGNMLYGRLAGWLGSLVLATSLYMFALSRVVLVDMPLSVFMVATLTAFLYAIHTPNKKRRNLFLYGMYIAAACATLTKGLIGFVLPGAVVFLWLMLSKNWHYLKKLKIISGTFLFLIIVVPWHVFVASRNPEFLHFYFIHEHFERYLTTVHGRYQPDWFFVVVFVAGLFPWISFAPQALKTGFKDFWELRNKDGKQLYLLIWMVFIFAFFSLSDSKLIPYILPIFPPVAALIGYYLAECWEGKPGYYFGLGLLIMLLFLLIIAAAPAFIPLVFDPASKVMVAIKQGGDDIRNMSIIAIIAGILMLVTYIQGNKRHLIITMLLSSAIIMQAGNSIAVHYNQDSMQQISETIKMLHKSGDEVVLYNEYYQDLPIYLGRRVSLVNWEKTELSFGATHEDTSAWMIDNKEFWKRWMKNDHLMFAVMREDAFTQVLHEQNKKPEELHLYGALQDGRNIVFMNIEPETKK